MADYTGVRLSPLVYSNVDAGYRPAIRLSPVVYEAVRSYDSIPSGGGGSAGRPLSGQLYPRGNR